MIHHSKVLDASFIFVYFRVQRSWLNLLTSAHGLNTNQYFLNKLETDFFIYSIDFCLMPKCIKWKQESKENKINCEMYLVDILLYIRA